MKAFVVHKYDIFSNIFHWHMMYFCPCPENKKVTVLFGNYNKNLGDLGHLACGKYNWNWRMDRTEKKKR